MDISHLLARVLGVSLIVIYTGMLLNRNFFRMVRAAVEQPLTIYLTGFLSFIPGLLIVNVHNIWTPNWQGIITFLGWVLVVTGALRLLFPEKLTHFALKMLNGSTVFLNIVAGTMVIIGLYLTYVGFQ